MAEWLREGPCKGRSAGSNPAHIIFHLKIIYLQIRIDMTSQEELIGRIDFQKQRGGLPDKAHLQIRITALKMVIRTEVNSNA